MSDTNLNNFIQEHEEDAKCSIAGIRSFKEYCDSFKQKVMMFLEGTTTDPDNQKFISLNHHVSETTAKVILLSKEQYNYALDHEDGSIDVKLNNTGEVLNVSCSDILNDIEEQTSEIAIQGDFLGYVLDNEQIRASEFSTNARVKYPGISGDIIQKYSSLLQENAALTSIQNFLFLQKSISAYRRNQGEMNEYIEIVYDHPSSYANPMIAAVVEVGKDISTFLGNVWAGITKIGSFFSDILGGIQSFLTFIAQKVSAPLVTVTEKASGKDGLIDIPFTQLELCDMRLDPNSGYRPNSIPLYSPEWNTLLSLYWNGASAPASGEHWYGFECPDYNNCGVKSDDVDNWPTKMVDVVSEIATAGTYNSGTDHYLRSYEVLIPSGGITHSIRQGYDCRSLDVMIRVGFDDNLKVWAQLFIVANYDDLSKYTDGEKLKIIDFSITDCFRYLFNLFGTCPTLLYDVDHMSNNEYYFYVEDAISKFFLDLTNLDASVEQQVDFYARFKAVNFNNRDVLVSGVPWQWRILKPLMRASIVRYLYFMGPAFDNSAVSFGKDKVVEALGFKYFPDDRSEDYSGDFINAFTIEQQQYVSNFDMNSHLAAYKPYAKYNLTPVSVHVQNFSEQLRELKAYIYGTVIAIAAIIVAVTVMKFTKRRRAKLIAAQGQLDSYSWDITGDPSESELQNLVRLQKKVKRIQRFNGILGIDSADAISLANSSNIFNIGKQLLSTQGYSETGSTDNYTLKSITDLIRGI